MSNVIAQPWGALWYLYSRGWWNRLRLQFRRLRQPRYIVGALAMLAYLGSLAFSEGARRGVVADPTLLDVRQLLSIVGLSLLSARGGWPRQVTTRSPSVPPKCISCFRHR